MLSTSFFTGNRKRLAEKLEPDTLAVFYSGREIPMSLDETYPFYTDNNYYYLTGLTEAEGLLVLYKDENGEVSEKLFIPEADPFKEKWVGYRISPDTAARISGIQNIDFIAHARKAADSLLGENTLLMYDAGQVTHQRWIADDDDWQAFISTHQTADISPMTASMRLIKQPEEIEEMRKAAVITGKALNAVFAEIHGGMYEYELAALFEYIVKKNGAQGLSFATIAASGYNGPTLHYVSNGSKLRSGDLILFDLGARLNGYAADVSRTVPVNGVYEGLEERIYSIVLEAQKELIHEYKQGARLMDIQQKTKDLYTEKLTRAGIKLPEGGIDDWYYHSVGHSLGLDTHDGTNRDLTLQDGMVITCEPGLYLREKGIGIRIEDDILVNGEDPIVLTDMIPKEKHEIEHLMR